MPQDGVRARLRPLRQTDCQVKAGLPRPTCLGCLGEFWYTPPRRWSNEMKLLALLSGKDA